MKNSRIINSEFKRRFSIYSSRVGRMVLKKELKHNCWFMHIPKSGGSSIHEALRAVIPMHQHTAYVEAVPTRRAASIYLSDKNDPQLVHEDGSRCKELFDLRDYQLLAHMAHNDALIYGHVLFSNKADKHFGDRYKYITILRDPVERVISNYRSAIYDKYFIGSLDEYLESDVARRHAYLNLRYFSGIAEIHEGKELDAMIEAKQNQDKFSVIGFLDDLNQFCSRFFDVFGAKLTVRHYNPSKSRTILPTSDQMRKLEELCQYDIALYERAKEL